MLDSLHDAPLAAVGLAIVVGFCAFAAGGLALARRHVLKRLNVRAEDGEFVSAVVQSVMVFYGLAAALIAVKVWENYSDVSQVVSREATTIAALYRDLGGYPEPTRSQARQQLREYTDQIIRGAWPEQRHGRVPSGGVELVDRMQATLFAFEPVSEGQRLLHGETLRAYNNLIEARRLRLDAVASGLPALLWFVLVAGAAISISSTFFFRVDDARLHTMLVVLLASFVGLVIFMVFGLDRPFRGDLAVDAGAYQLIYDHLMTAPD